MPLERHVRDRTRQLDRVQTLDDLGKPRRLLRREFNPADRLLIVERLPFCVERGALFRDVARVAFAATPLAPVGLDLLKEQHALAVHDAIIEANVRQDVRLVPMRRPKPAVRLHTLPIFLNTLPPAWHRWERANDSRGCDAVDPLFWHPLIQVIRRAIEHVIQFYL